MNNFEQHHYNNKSFNYDNERCKDLFIKNNNNNQNIKIKDDDIDYNLFNKFDNYSLILKNKYNIKQLKAFAKIYKIKISGNRNEILFRLFTFLYLSFNIVKIQKKIRTFIQVKYNKLKGPALLNRNLCTNTTDFLTMENIKDLSYSQFFSFTDVDGFIYGFNIISIHNLIIKSKQNVQNPYNRNIIHKDVIQNIDKIIKMSKTLSIKIDIIIQDVNNDISLQKSIELKALDIFQNINALGNYSEPSWFLSLNRLQLYNFIGELYDIWDYRAQLTIDVKKKICPPYGDPFNNFHLILNNERKFIKVQQLVLNLIHKFVNSGIDNDNKSLGAYYVLGALTIVNPNAAESLPWLYQSVNHI